MSTSEPTGPPARPPNVVTVVLDCARAKNFAASGGGTIARTPALDALAARGTSFSHALAPANWTVPSHFSIFTGRPPNVHGVRTFQKVPGVPETTATYLKGRGYETAMFTENLHLAGGYGLEEGFELLRSRRINVSREERTVINRLTRYARFLYSARMRHLLARLPPLVAPLSTFFHSQEIAYKNDVCGPFTVDWFDEWLQSRAGDRPFYAFLNFVDTHDPYTPSLPSGRLGFLDRAYLNTPGYYVLSVPGFQDHLRWEGLVNAYVRTIEEADRKVGQLVRSLEARGERDRTWIIVTSDHGQQFGELGNFNHGCGATDSVLRVPLYVAPPRGVSLPPRVDRWVSLTEVDGWIRSAVAGRDPFAADEAPSAGPRAPARNSGPVLCEGGPVSDQVRSLKGVRSDQAWNHRLLAAYDGRRKLVVDLETSEMWEWQGEGDLDAVAPTRLGPEAAAEARRAVFAPYEAAEAARVARAAGGPAAVDVEIDERLKSWGYD